MKKPMVKLNNGKEVLLEEFVTWHPTKQHKWTVPIEEKKATLAKMGLTKRKAVNTPIGQFSKFNEAVKALGITKDALRALCLNTAYPLYSYVNPTEKDIAKQYHRVYKGGPKKTVTPIGTFATIGLAAKALAVTFDQMAYLIKTQPNKYYYSEDNVNIGTRKTHDPTLFHPTKGYRLAKVYMTPTGPFASIKQAAFFYGLLVEEIEYLSKKHPTDFYKIKK